MSSVSSISDSVVSSPPPPMYSPTIAPPYQLSRDGSVVVTANGSPREVQADSLTECFYSDRVLPWAESTLGYYPTRRQILQALIQVSKTPIDFPLNSPKTLNQIVAAEIVKLLRNGGEKT